MLTIFTILILTTNHLQFINYKQFNIVVVDIDGHLVDSVLQHFLNRATQMPAKFFVILDFMTSEMHFLMLFSERVFQ